MFRTIDADIAVAGQLTPAQMQAAADAGFRTIVNNRPEQEEPGQPAGADVAAAAAAAGLAYHAIPMTHGALSEDQVAAMRAAIEGSDGPLLAFCRSGTRSTMLWAIARARIGDHPDTLAAKAAAAGYDLTPVMGLLHR